MRPHVIIAGVLLWLHLYECAKLMAPVALREKQQLISPFPSPLWGSAVSKQIAQLLTVA